MDLHLYTQFRLSADTKEIDGVPVTGIPDASPRLNMDILSVPTYMVIDSLVNYIIPC